MSLAPDLTGPVFDHLHRLTDGRGLFEHALHGEPRPEHGYCVDDVARALAVVCREPDPSPSTQYLVARYLDFTTAAVTDDGTCHNRMSTRGDWTDDAGLGDWWGRAVWGLGVAAVRAPTAELRAQALAGFSRAAARRSPHQRALVFAGLGAGELLLAGHASVPAHGLLRDAVAAIGPVGNAPAWPWPQARLTYGNGSVVEALLLTGLALGDTATGQRGLQLLDFLLTVETRDGHLSPTPVVGRGPGESAPAFDQQPIEVAALADACARAFELTADPRWAHGVGMAWGWFLGDNDTGIPMYDPLTGAAYDGLERGGRNLNQGAESTLAALSTAQHARRIGVLAGQVPA